MKVLFETLSAGQREKICFPWDHKDAERGLLRTRIAANWDITENYINDTDFYTKDQQAIIRKIFEGIISPEWHERIDKQLKTTPAATASRTASPSSASRARKQFEFVMTGRHMTIRCDGNSADHVAFGGPIFYGHAADRSTKKPTHPGNVFWPQAQAANKLYQMLDGKQQKLALLREGLPNESRVGFRGKDGKFQGMPVTRTVERPERAPAAGAARC